MRLLKRLQATTWPTNEQPANNQRATTN